MKQEQWVLSWAHHAIEGSWSSTMGLSAQTTTRAAPIFVAMLKLPRSRWVHCSHSYLTHLWRQMKRDPFASSVSLKSLDIAGPKNSFPVMCRLHQHARGEVTNISERPWMIFEGWITKTLLAARQYLEAELATVEHRSWKPSTCSTLQWARDPTSR